MASLYNVPAGAMPHPPRARRPHPYRTTSCITHAPRPWGFRSPANQCDLRNGAGGRGVRHKITRLGRVREALLYREERERGPNATEAFLRTYTLGHRPHTRFQAQPWPWGSVPLPRTPPVLHTLSEVTLTHKQVIPKTLHRTPGALNGGDLPVFSPPPNPPSHTRWA